MKRKGLRGTVIALLGVCMVLALALSVSAQPAGGRPQRGNRGGDDNRRRFDPAEMRARMMERLQERLEMGDDEWKVVEPLVADVFSKQRELRQNRFGFGRRRRPEAAEEGAEQSTPADELSKALENEDATPEDIKAKLESFRQDRTAKEAALDASQEKLRDVLTIEQEAKLVLMGMLE